MAWDRAVHTQRSRPMRPLTFEVPQLDESNTWKPLRVRSVCGCLLLQSVYLGAVIVTGSTQRRVRSGSDRAGTDEEPYRPWQPLQVSRGGSGPLPARPRVTQPGGEQRVLEHSVSRTGGLQAPSPPPPSSVSPGPRGPGLTNAGPASSAN